MSNLDTGCTVMTLVLLRLLTNPSTQDMLLSSACSSDRSHFKFVGKTFTTGVEQLLDSKNVFRYHLGLPVKITVLRPISDEFVLSKIYFAPRASLLAADV